MSAESGKSVNECSFTVLVPFTNKKTPVETPVITRVKTTVANWGVRV